MTIKKNSSSALDFIRIYLEYVLVVLVVLECNSLFGQAENNNDGVWFWSYVYSFCLCIAVAILFLQIAKLKRLSPLLSSIPVLLVYFILTVLFFCLNVQPLAPDKSQDYFIRFILFLPLLICIFRYDRESGTPFNLWFRYSDIMVVFSALNLIVFLFLTVFPDALQSDPIQTRWTGHLATFHNFYNVCSVVVGVHREIFGLRIFRNFSIFTEPLMFCIPLITSLSTELFLRADSRKWFLRSLILSLAIFTAQSDLGFILFFIIWGLKLMLLMPSKYRKIVFPIIALMVVSGCFVIFWRKGRFYGNDELSSLGMHIMDYKFGLMALREKPLLGGGYWNDSFISSFMPADRFAKNPGLSNTFAAVIGEGGILFSIICMLPYVIGGLQFFHRGNRHLAFWTFGVFGVFFGIIFRFRLYLMMVLAFGYSLFEFDITKRRFTIFPQLTNNVESSSVEEPLLSKRGAGFTLLAIIALLIILVLRTPLFSASYAFLNSHRFLLGQSIWRTLLLLLISIFFVCLLFYISKDETVSKIHRLIVVTYSCAISVVYFLLYPRISELISAVFQAFHIQAEPWGSILLLFIYTIALLLPLIAVYHLTAWMRYKRSRIAICIIALFMLCLGGHKASSIIQYQSQFIPEDDIHIITEIAAVPGSKIYTNHDTALYHRRNSNVLFTAAKGRGFVGIDHASVLFEDGTDLNELFNAGYQVTRISNSSLLYSNDENVISELEDQGYTFYRYYAYPVYYKMDTAAQLNNLTRTESGAVLVEGEEYSLVNGPYDYLDANTYTVTYNLKLKSTNLISLGNKPICTLQVCCNNGSIVITGKELYVDDFSSDGIVEADLLFAYSDIHDVEYRVLANEGISIEVRSIAICKTPGTVTISDFDSLGQPVVVRYFHPDGNPKELSGGYYAVSYTYDHLGQVISEKYLNAATEPLSTQNGYAEIRYIRNLYGYVTRESYHDVDGHLTLTPLNYAVIEREYINDGKTLASQRYLDAELSPVLCSDGFAECRFIHDEKNRVVKEEYIDTSGALTTCPGGYAAAEYEYDAAGNKNVLRFYDDKGALSLRKEGYAELHRIFNKRNWIAREEYYGTDGLPTILAAGHSSVEYEYDDIGNRTVYRYYDINGNLVAITDGYAELRRTYNGKNQVLHEAFFNTDGTPATLAGGYSAREFQYDNDGNQICISFLDSLGHHCETRYGYSEIHRIFSNDGVLEREMYYDLAGNEVLLK